MIEIKKCYQLGMIELYHELSDKSSEEILQFFTDHSRFFPEVQNMATSDYISMGLTNNMVVSLDELILFAKLFSVRFPWELNGFHPEDGGPLTNETDKEYTRMISSRVGLVDNPTLL